MRRRRPRLHLPNRLMPAALHINSSHSSLTATAPHLRIQYSSIYDHRLRSARSSACWCWISRSFSLTTFTSALLTSASCASCSSLLRLASRPTAPTEPRSASSSTRCSSTCVETTRSFQTCALAVPPGGSLRRYGRRVAKGGGGRRTSNWWTRAPSLIALRSPWFWTLTASSCACSSACRATPSAFRICGGGRSGVHRGVRQAQGPRTEVGAP